MFESKVIECSLSGVRMVILVLKELQLTYLLCSVSNFLSLWCEIAKLWLLSFI